MAVVIYDTMAKRVQRQDFGQSRPKGSVPLIHRDVSQLFIPSPVLIIRFNMNVKIVNPSRVSALELLHLIPRVQTIYVHLYPRMCLSIHGQMMQIDRRDNFQRVLEERGSSSSVDCGDDLWWNSIWRLCHRQR